MTKPLIELSEQVYDARYFSFSNADIKSRSPVNVFFGGIEHCHKDYRIDRSGFPVYLLEYVVQGRADLILDGQEAELKKGCLYWYGPGIPCNLVTDPNQTLVKYFLAFRCPEGSPGGIYGLDRLFIGANRGGEQVGELVRMLFEEAISANEESWRICCSLMDIILLKCTRSVVMEQHTKEQAWGVFKSVKEHIEDNYLEIHRMEDVSRETNLTAAYISRLFKRYYHMSPYNFLMQKKMEHALNLLRQGNMPVQQAASLTGFDDPFHFSRVFKKFKGISPSEVRNVSA